MSRRMRLRASFGFIALALVAAVSASILSIGQPVHASPADAVIKKAIGYGIAQCYKQGAMVSPITAESYNDNWGPSSIVSYGGGSYAMPTGAYNGVYSLSCAELLNGNGVNGAFPGAYSIAGVTPPENASNTSAFESFMTSMGYTKHNADGGGRCASFTYASGSDTDVTKLCAETDSQGHITGGVTYQGSGLVFRIDVTDTQVKPICTQLFDSFATNSCSAISYTKNSTDFEWLAGQVLSQLIAHRANGFLGGSYKLVEKVDFESRGNALAEYRIDNKTTAGNRALKTLTGYANENATKLTPPEQQSLLQDYLLNYYGVQNYGCDLSSDQQGVASSAGYAKIETSMFGGTLQTCWIRPTKNQNSSVAAFNSQGFFDGTSMDYDAVVKALGGSVNDMKAADKQKCTDAATLQRQSAEALLNSSTTSEEYRKRAQATIDSINEVYNTHHAYWHEENGAIVCYPFTKIDGTTSDTPTDSTTPPDTPSENPEDTGEAGALDGCFGNAGVLGWIVCPVIKFVGETLGGIYDLIIENYLTMGASTVSQDAVRTAWSQFQGYANIIFAILLVFVILSQVTGIGLNNYGIKKVLPKLIVTVILVNISFLLCAIAIDISNIVGSSINDYLKGLDVGGMGADDFNLAVFATNTLTSLFSVGAAAGTISIAVYTITISGGWGMLLLPLLLALITALIGIIFFFILLGVRQAAIILLLVISPIAVVCYALPNTKKFFDRWIKMFSGLLLVYPICGLMMGGGNLASRILLTAGSDAGFLYFLVAMLVQVVPFFLIPSVLKSSMAAIGGLGAKIAGMGDKLSSFTTRSIRNSRGYQERQQEALRNSNMVRNRRIMDRTELSNTQQARLAALRAKEATWRAGKGAALTGSERRELRSLSSRQYRYARAASARERGVLEDAMSDVSSRREMLEHGSARYEKIVAGAMREQRNRDDAGQVALYEDGKVQALNGSGVVKADSLDSLADEHMSLLKQVADHPEDEAAASKLRAVQTLLGKMGSNGFDKMENNFGRLMATHSQFDNSNSAGLSIASSHLSRNFAGQIKANSRAFDALLNDINKGGTLANQGTFSQQDFDDLKGGTVSRYVSSHYGSKGAQSIKAENVNDLGDAYYDNLLRATIKGDLRGADLEQVLKVFNEAEMAADAGKLTLKGEVRQRIKAIKDAAYASSQTYGGSPRSEGSRMIGAAGSTGIDSIVQQISAAGNWSAMSTPEKQKYSALVNNITDSLKQDAHTVENVRQLQGALREARLKGIETAVTGGSLVSQVSSADLHAFKIPRGAPQKVNQPLNAQRAADGRWYANGGMGRALTPEEVAKAEQIERHNNRIDIENGEV